MSKKLTDQRPFSFRQFSLHHHQSTMKVGVDAILLAVWTRLSGKERVLEIGTGSGVIALLLASRGVQSVLAIDIDQPSVEEACRNFKQSEYSQQLTAIHVGLQEFSADEEQGFDLIISNPPFFDRGVVPRSERLGNARHTRTLSYAELLRGAKKHLSPEGILSVVLPYSVMTSFVELAVNHGLYLQRRLLIFPRRGMNPNRVNMEFSSQKAHSPITEMLPIREENNDFSREYLQYVDGYYL